MKITRQEYEKGNCLTHLTNRVSRQESHFKQIISQQEEQITQLQEKIVKLNEEVSRVHCQGTQSKNEIRLLQEKLSELNNKSSISLYTPPKCHWRICQNMKTSLEQKNILEYLGGTGFAQLFYPLEPSRSCFKVRILRHALAGYGGYAIVIGFTQKQHPATITPGLNELSAGCSSDGMVYVDRRRQKIGKPWKAGDIIKCGINYQIDGTNSIEVYFSLNEELIAKNLMIVPSDLARDAFFPTMYMWGPQPTRGSRLILYKVEYLIN